MTLAKDKRQHLQGGLVVGLLAWLVLLVGSWNTAAAIALAGTAVGGGWEWLQGFRREGQPDHLDALATAAGAWVVAAFVQWGWPLIPRGM
jgi:uncharacterized membrane protein